MRATSPGRNVILKLRVPPPAPKKNSTAGTGSRRTEQRGWWRACALGDLAGIRELGHLEIKFSRAPMQPPRSLGLVGQSEIDMWMGPQI